MEGSHDPSGFPLKESLTPERVEEVMTELTQVVRVVIAPGEGGWWLMFDQGAGLRKYHQPFPTLTMATVVLASTLLELDRFQRAHPPAPPTV